jgi:hypothetical protein
MKGQASGAPAPRAVHQSTKGLINKSGSPPVVRASRGAEGAAAGPDF